jgi:hypothetical protein
MRLVVVPLFALTNAGVHINADQLRHATTSRITLGIVTGLVGRRGRADPLSPREHGARHRVSHVAGVVAFDVNETRPQPHCARRTVRASLGEQRATPTTIFQMADIEGGAG